MDVEAAEPEPERPLPQWTSALAVALAVAAVGVAVALFVPVLIGLLVMGLLLSPWGVGERARSALLEALVALRPLVLPLLCIAVLASLNESRAIQLIIGAVVAAVLVPWLLPGKWRGRPASGTVQSQALVAGLLALGLGAVVVVVSYAALQPDVLDDFGGWPTSLAFASVAVWAVAAVLRVLGLGTSPLRLLFCVLLIAAALREVLALGVLWVSWDADQRPTTTHLLAFAGLAFTAYVLLEVACALAQRVPGWLKYLVNPRTWKFLDRLSAYGLGVAVSATVLILLAVVWGSIESKQAARASTEGLRSATGATADYEAYRDPDLAYAFMPVLRFDADARWTPRLVDSYLERSKLIRPRVTIRRPHLADLKKGCRNPFTDPCFKLTIECEQALEDDGTVCPSTQRHTPLAGEPYHDEGAIYVRVVRRDDPPDREPNPFESFGPEDIQDRLRILIQYWLFYDYDEWVAPVLGGRIIQRHEGDWEAVTVGVAADRPLFVAYSQHCGGVWQRWDGVRVVDTTAQPYAGGIAISGPGDHDLGIGPENWNEARLHLSHPAVSVAVGSQANYPPARAGRAPNWDICQGFGSATVSLLSDIWNIRDRTGQDYEWLPLELRLVNAHTPPMTFPGTWGDRDTFEYVTTSEDTGEPKVGLGPRTPTRQDLWRDPVRRIFCGEGWRHARKQDRNYEC